MRNEEEGSVEGAGEERSVKGGGGTGNGRGKQIGEERVWGRSGVWRWKMKEM